VDADPHRAVVQPLDREGVVDLGGGHVVDREGGHLGQRQAGRRGRDVDRREAGAAREVLEQEARHVQFLGRGHAAGGQHQALRGGLQFAGGGLQRLEFDAVLVRLEQQLLHQRLHRGRQRPAFSSST
jgi:hypothetical protein